MAIRLFTAAGLALVLSAACTPVLGDADDSDANQVFGVVYESLSERYIKPVDSRSVSLAGLHGLSALDKSLEVSAPPGKVILKMHGAPVGEFTAPLSRDEAGWARLMADAVVRAEEVSEPIRTSGREAVYAAVIKPALSGLDRYTRYATAAAARRNRASRDGFNGLGISIRTEDGVTTIARVHDGTPAARAGLEVGDILTRADGVPLAGMETDDVVTRLRGPAGSTVVLTLKRKNVPTPFDLTVARARVVIPTVVAKTDGSILILQVSGFNQGTSEAVRRAVSRAKSAHGGTIEGVVLDLRGNPGGLLDQAVRLADLFLTDGRIVSTIGRHPQSFQVFDAHRRDYADGAPVVVLVNGRSASSAEIVAAALRDRGRAVLLGTTSFGKGTVQTIVTLPNGGELIMTWAKLQSPGGLAFHDLGIPPAVCTADIHDAKVVLADLRRHLSETHSAQVARLDREAVLEARRACPPEDEEQTADLVVAEQLIHDPALYRSALTRGVSVAEQPFTPQRR